MRTLAVHWILCPYSSQIGNQLLRLDKLRRLARRHAASAKRRHQHRAGGLLLEWRLHRIRIDYHEYCGADAGLRGYGSSSDYYTADYYTSNKRPTN